MELLKASETERINILKERFKLSERDFSSLSRYEKRSVSLAMGFKNVNEALQVFGTEQEKIAQYTQRARDANITTEEFAKRAKTAATFTKKWNVLLQRLSVILLPVIKWITLAFGIGAAAGPLTLTGAIIGAIGTFSLILATMGALALGIKALRWAMGGLGDDFSKVADSGAKFAGAISSLAGIGFGNLNQIRKFFNTFKEIKADNVNAISGALKEFQNTIVKVETTRREDIKRTFDLNINIEEPEKLKQDIRELFDEVTLSTRRMNYLTQNAGS